MTISNSGAVGTAELSQQLNGPGVTGARVSTSDDAVKRLVKKTSGITFPNDMHGKGWGQQMTYVGSNESAVNDGNSANMRPYLMDRRVDGGKNLQPYDHKLDGSKSWFGGIFIENSQNNSAPAPREAAWNGYFYMHNPYYQGPQFNLNSYIQYESTWVYGPGSCRTSFNLIGFSAGYLSGNRKTLGSVSKNGTASGAFAPFGYYDSGYRHVAVNLAQWQDAGGGTSTTYMYNGSAE